MSTAREAFTDEQWDALVETAARTPVAIMGASPHGGLNRAFESYRVDVYISGSHELPSALVREVTDAITAPAESAGHPLMAQVREDLDANAGDGQAGVDRFLAATYDVARRAGAALSATTEDEADAYRNWVIKLALTTAEGSVEGGFLGFGGHRVSEAEARVMTELTLALEGE